MATIHGSWIGDPEVGSFFIWGETWRTVDPKALTDDPEAIALHPFAMDREEFLTLFNRHRLGNRKRLEGKEWQSQVITLPSHQETTGKKSSRRKKNVPFLPILSGSFPPDPTEMPGVVLRPWQVIGMFLSPQETVQFLQALPLGSFPNDEEVVGGGLRFWSHLYRWSLDLLTRCKVLPGITQDQEGNFRTCWQPLLDSQVDQIRLATFTQKMPAICCAYGISKTGQDPQGLVLSFLRHVVDIQMRRWITRDMVPVKKDSLGQQWMRSLSEISSQPGISPTLEVEPMTGKRLELVLNNWTSPVQRDIITPQTQQFAQHQFRTCFTLQPPEANAPETEEKAPVWYLNYGLRPLDNPDFIVDGETIWQHPVERLEYEGRIIEQPQETLLRGLGLASRLYAPIAESLNHPQPHCCELDPIQVYEFIRAVVWRLQDSGLGVILPAGLAPGIGKKRLGVTVQAEVDKTQGKRLGLQSLLSFKLELAFGDKTLSKADFERLLDQRSPLVEVEGEWIALQPADVRAAQAIVNASHTEMALSVEDALRLSTGDTTTLAKLPVVGFQASGILQDLINALTNNQQIQILETPEGFRGELRPYQRRGMSWLAFLEQWGLGACLADDMGLGKTIQTLAFLLKRQEEESLNAPTLLVCPTSVLGNWEREVRKFSPTLKVLVHHGEKRRKGASFLMQAKSHNLVLTSYALVPRDLKSLEKVEWEGIILDEAQNIKNPQAKQSQAVRDLKAGFRIALTGTPVENRLSELWSILEFLNPGFLGTKQFFQKRFAIPIEKYGDQDSLKILRSLVQPFILRRLKTDKDIITDLPDKQEMNIFCGLSAEQATLYQKLVDQSLQKIEASEGIKRHGLILTLLSKLKQLCNHPGHFLKEKILETPNRSGKLLRLEEMLEELVLEGDRALIFTQFAEWGKLLKPYLEKKFGREVFFLYGATRRKQREEMVDRFQHDPTAPPIFILSLKAGGTGLNLTRANHVFHVDRWWNPAVENQATDRAFRIGQKRNVQVHKFVCTGTLEERINDIIESKKQLAQQTVDAGEQWLTQMDTDQLRNLLLLDREGIIDD